MVRRKRKRILAGGAGLLLLLPAWLLFGPSQLGGGMSYVIVAKGTSMEPGFRAGDLALVRGEDGYGVGDVIAYRSEELRSVVLHRIVGRSDGGYVVQGDGNDFVDPERPTDAEVLGKLRFRLPQVGAMLGWLRRPVNASVGAGLAVFLLVAGIGGPRLPRRRSGPRAGAGDAQRGSHPVGSEPPNDPPAGDGSPRTALMVAGASLAASALLALVAFARPMTVRVTDEFPYRHVGAFDYGASAPEGPVYEGGRVTTGDPVFLRLVDRVEVDFAYHLESEAPLNVAGTHRLLAVVSDVSGWRRSLVLSPSTPFAGTALEVRGSLDLAVIRSLTDRVEAATGVTRDAYAIDLVAEVAWTGSLEGAEVRDAFAPKVGFRLDPNQLQVVAPNGSLLGEEDRDPFRPEERGSAIVPREEAAALSLPGIRVPVAAARLVAVLGGLLSLLALRVLGRPFLRSLRGDEASRIAARYPAWLVAARGPAPSLPVVDVAEFQGLLRIAEHAERPILHRPDGPGHVYFVEDGGCLYRYRTAPGGDGAGSRTGNRPSAALHRVP